MYNKIICRLSTLRNKGILNLTINNCKNLLVELSSLSFPQFGFNSGLIGNPNVIGSFPLNSCKIRRKKEKQKKKRKRNINIKFSHKCILSFTIERLSLLLIYYSYKTTFFFL